MTARSRLAAVAVAALAALPSASLAQYSPESQYSSSEFFRPHAELTAIAGYQVNTDVGISEGHLSVDDAPVYGAALAWLTHPAIRAELLWLYNPTVHASGTLALETSAPFHVPTHYFQIGGSTGRRFDRLGRSSGAPSGPPCSSPTGSITRTASTSLGDTWRFAFTIGGGLNIHLSEKLALRGEARVAAPVYFSSGSIYVGGGARRSGVSGGIPIWQWNFLGGLVFALIDSAARGAEIALSRRCESGRPTSPS